MGAAETKGTEAITARNKHTAAGTAALATLVQLSACAGSFPPPGPPAYQAGYSAGCYSGWAEAGREGAEPYVGKEMARYDGEADYKRGWDEAYATCYDDEWRQPEMMGGEPAAL